MCKRFDDWSHEIKIFCEVNGFSFEKARKLSKSWGKDDLVLQYYDPNNDTAKKDWDCLTKHQCLLCFEFIADQMVALILKKRNIQINIQCKYC